MSSQKPSALDFSQTLLRYWRFQGLQQLRFLVKECSPSYLERMPKISCNFFSLSSLHRHCGHNLTAQHFRIHYQKLQWTCQNSPLRSRRVIIKNEREIGFSVELNNSSSICTKVNTWRNSCCYLTLQCREHLLIYYCMPFHVDISNCCFLWVTRKLRLREFNIWISVSKAAACSITLMVVPWYLMKLKRPHVDNFGML